MQSSESLKATDAGQPSEAPAASAETDEPVAMSGAESRRCALVAAARHLGMELDLDEFPAGPGDAPPSAAAAVEWLRRGGLWARATRLSWSQLIHSQPGAGTVVLLLDDGGAAILSHPDPANAVVWLKDPSAAPGEDGEPVDALRLSRVWSGQVILVRADHSDAPEAQPFSFGWLGRMVWLERKTLRDVCLGSAMLSVLAILPPLLVMVVVDRVVTYQSFSTLTLIALLLVIATVYETYLGYIRRQLTQIIGTRLDAKLNLHIFNKVLGLPIDYFERTQTGAVMYQLGQIYRVRDFITGKVLSTILDMITLAVLLPVLFWLSLPLTWMVVGCAVLISLVILAFLQPVRRVYSKWQAAEVAKSTVLVETVYGIRTVKSLALESHQRATWDRRTANAASCRQALGDVSNWPQTLVTPLEAFMNRGVLLVGAWLAINGGETVAVGSLVAFMMLSGRVSAPLVGLARLMEDLEEARGAVAMAAHVLNNPPETMTPGAGLRPRFQGAISFGDVAFAYPGSRQRALDGVSFEVPVGTMLGVVGRSGSGKSTVTRLLQGFNREYEGQIKIDGIDLRAVNLAHLRRSLGVVLQDNFLFRGSIHDNIIAGRPGLTLSDTVRAARLAGAEEFIERLPRGYETLIEEGSPNLSGGQRQRLAIARALIHNPSILILDEATSALDPESEALVSANIQRIAAGRTMMIVSHRLSSLTDCDQILVLDRGQVARVGTHDELLEHCPIYRQLWHQQNRLPAGLRSVGPRPVGITA